MRLARVGRAVQLAAAEGTSRRAAGRSLGLVNAFQESPDPGVAKAGIAEERVRHSGPSLEISPSPRQALRLLGGRFVLKAELGDAALQILVPSGRTFGPADGIVAKLGLGLPLEAPVGRIVDLWRVSGRPPPPRRGWARDGKIARWCRCWTG